MKKIIIYAVGLSLLNASFPSLAYKILGEEKYSTPGFNLQVVEKIEKPKKKVMSARVRTSVPNQTGRVNNFNQIDGHHYLDITNQTGRSQTYSYTYSLDCEEAHSYFTRHVELASGESFSTSAHTYGVVQKSYPGSFRIAATTKISGESSTYDNSYGTLTISN